MHTFASTSIGGTLTIQPSPEYYSNYQRHTEVTLQLGTQYPYFPPSLVDPHREKRIRIRIQLLVDDFCNFLFPMLTFPLFIFTFFFKGYDFLYIKFFKL